MKNWKFLTARALFVFAILLVTHLGCSDECKCGASDQIVLPFEGSVDVPTNTKIWVGASSCDPSYPAELLDSEGDSVPLTRSCIMTGFDYSAALQILHPSEPLVPNSAYSIKTALPINLELVTQSFFTGSGPAEEIPGLPGVENFELEHHVDTGCGKIRYLSYELYSDGDLLLLDAGNRSMFDDIRLSGVVSATGDVGSGVVLGATACEGDNFPGGTSLSATTTVRFGTLSLTGKFSGWTEAETARMNGCRVTNTQSPICLVFVMLFLCWGRSPKRTKSAY